MPTHWPRFVRDRQGDECKKRHGPPAVQLATFRGCKARFLTIWPPHDAAEIVLLAERKLGDMLAVVQESGQGELVAGIIELAHEQATGF